MLRKGTKGIIRVSDKINNVGRRRFTIAHEFGHFILHVKAGESFHCTDDDIAAWYEQQKPMEHSANLFAAELLMPTKFVGSFVNSNPFDANHIRELGEDYKVSFMAAALRFIEFVKHDQCAIVKSQYGKVCWFKPSRTFDYYIEIGSPVSDFTCASNYFKYGSLHSKPEQVQAFAWITDQRVNQKACLIEHSIKIGSESVLSLLFIDDAIIEDELDDEERGLDPFRDLKFKN